MENSRAFILEVCRMNQWVFKDNQHSRKIKQFLAFVKLNPVQIILLSPDKIEGLLEQYVEYLSTINAESTITSKVDSVILFFQTNNIEIKNDYSNYNELIIGEEEEW